MKAEYEKQQTPEGQAALNAGEVQPLYDAGTGKIKQYFIAL